MDGPALPHTTIALFRPSAPGRITLSHQILLHHADGPLWIAIPAPILTCDRALLVGVGLNQARIDCKAFAPTRPDAMQASTTRSNTWRKTSRSRKRSLRARETPNDRG
jgi:hypothetical protein